MESARCCSTSIRGPDADRVYTDPPPLLLRQLRRNLGSAATDALVALRSSSCPPANLSTSQPSLCHEFCEVGATPFVDTLGHMVRTGRRLVVVSQHQGGNPPWPLPASRDLQDTPFEFATVADLSCEPNRGPTSAPMFLVNHWLDGGDSTVAAEVNAAAVLEPRMRTCEAERGAGPISSRSTSRTRAICTLSSTTSTGSAGPGDSARCEAGEAGPVGPGGLSPCGNVG